MTVASTFAHRWTDVLKGLNVTSASPTPTTTSADIDVEHPVDGSPSTRRTMLRRAAALGAVLGVAGAVSATNPAAAADGDALVLGTTNSHATTTNVNYSGPTVAASMNVQSGDQTAANDGILNGLFANAGTALLGVASGNGNQGIGIIGWSKKPLGTGLVGFTGGAGAYGGEFFGGLAEVRLRPGGNQPIDLADTHQVGELYEDATGTLWLCVAAGTPGTWRELGGRRRPARSMRSPRAGCTTAGRPTTSWRPASTACCRWPTRSTAPSTSSPAWPRP